MTARIVVFGATGYTGRLVLAELVALGCRPVVAGRSAPQVEALAAEHGGLDAAVADATRPGSVRALLEPGDVLVTTVGPYAIYGQAALDAAVDAGAHYLDLAGEAGFVREVFGEAGPRARAAGCALLPGFGFFFLGGTRFSSGTRATATLTVQQQGHARRGGALVTRPFAAELRSFSDGARRRLALGAAAHRDGTGRGRPGQGRHPDPRGRQRRGRTGAGQRPPRRRRPLLVHRPDRGRRRPAAGRRRRSGERRARAGRRPRPRPAGAGLRRRRPAPRLSRARQLGWARTSRRSARSPSHTTASIRSLAWASPPGRSRARQPTMRAFTSATSRLAAPSPTMAEKNPKNAVPGSSVAASCRACSTSRSAKLKTIASNSDSLVGKCRLTVPVPT